jgi:hypothetical protein
MLGRAVRALVVELARSAIAAIGTQVGEAIGKRIGARIYTAAPAPSATADRRSP